MAASFGKMPTTLVRRLISALRRPTGMVEAICSVGEHVVLGSIHQNGELWEALSETIGTLAPLLAASRVSCADRAQLGSDHRPLAGRDNVENCA